MIMTIKPKFQVNNKIIVYIITKFKLILLWKLTKIKYIGAHG